MPTSILPLQHATLIVDKRVGSISMRSILVAARKIPGRAEDPALDTDAIKDAFLRVEPFDKLLAIQARVEGMLTALREIRQIFIDKAGYETAPQFEQLPELLTSISTYVAEIIRERAPVSDQESAVSEDDEPGATDEAQADGAMAGSQSPENVRTVGEAANALEAILGYYAASEPSSPSRLLIKQAHQLVGKTFVEAMRVLAPGMAEETRIRIGGDSPFSLDFSQLSALADEEVPREGASDEARRYSASTRSEATALMRKVEQFYRSTEPSSPIPLLVERARNFVARDFASLLKEMAKRDENN
jgi:type VI secretion system protein ImpA